MKTYIRKRGELFYSKRMCSHCKKKTLFILNEKTNHSYCKVCGNWEVKLKKKKEFKNKSRRGYKSSRDLLLEEIGA